MLELVEPTGVVLNVSELGDRVTAAVPLPLRVTVCGLVDALSVNVSAPLAAPSATGAKVTMQATASAALLIPSQSREALGLELMPIALAYLTLSSLATFHASHSEGGVSRDRLVRYIVGLLSAGLIFAGYEFTDQTDPFEAGIGFTVPLKSKQDDFTGRAALERRQAAPQRVLAGLELAGAETAGHGDCVHVGRSQVGVVTSGARSPLLRKNIALARIAVEYAAIGTEVEVGKLDGHQKRIPAQVVRFLLHAVVGAPGLKPLLDLQPAFVGAIRRGGPAVGGGTVVLGLGCLSGQGFEQFLGHDLRHHGISRMRDWRCGRSGT